MEKNKSGQIGLTLTWFTAFLIVFFIMLLFIAMVSILASKKAVSRLVGVGGGFDEIEMVFSKNFGSAESQKNLFYLINSPVEGNKDLKQLILEWDILKNSQIKAEIESTAKGILEAMAGEEECYFFMINYDKLNPLNKGILIQKTDRSFYKKSDLDFEEQASKIKLARDSQEVNIGLYFGKC